MENNKVICYYHNDMDGIMSASIVDWKFPSKTKFVKVDYGYEWKKEDIQNKICIVVDFSFDNMKELSESCNRLCWIDHHATARDKNPDVWNDKSIEGIRDITKAGCELTWNHYFPYVKIPECVFLVADRDMWKFEYGDMSKAFHEYVSMVFKTPTVDLINDDAVNMWLEKGRMLLEKKKSQVRKSFEQGIDSAFFGHKTRVINTNMNVSDVGEYCYKEMKYPIALIWSIRGDKIVCSLRSNILNVREMAESYGGGGHKFAAGFEGDFEFLKTFYE